MQNLGKNVLISLCQAGLADGSTDPNSTAVDMDGWDSVLFIGIIGAQDAAGTAAIQADGSTDNSTFVAITGALATSPINSDDKLLIVDVVKPLDRYIRTTLTRGGTTNTTWGGTIAIQYNGRKLPSTHLNTAVAMTTVIGGA